MRSLRLLLIVISLILPPFSLAAQTAPEPTVTQLKEEIQKLQTIERDESISAEVKELNRAFLQKRRVQLHTLLQKKIDGLQKYLTTLEASLTPEEKLIVQNTISDTHMELQNLTAATGVRVGNDLATTQPTTVPPTSPDSASDASVNLNGHATGNGAGAPAVSASLLSTAGTASVTGSAQPAVQPQGSLNLDLNTRIREKINTLSRARVDQTDNTKQTDVSSVASSSGSLVDQSSASDLIGLATNFAGLSATSNDAKEDPTSVSVTASAYSLLAAIKRVDPLNPVFYDQNRKWRNFSVTLGYDDEDQPDGTKQRAKIFGGKFMFINRRDPGLKRNHDYIMAVGDQLETASKVFGDLSLRVGFYIFSLDSVKTNIVAPGFRTFLERRKTEAPGELQAARDALAAGGFKTAAERQKAVDRVARAEETIPRINRMLRDYDSSIGSWFGLGNNSLPSGWSREELQYQTEFANQFLVGDYRQKLGDDVSTAIDEFIDRQLTEPQLQAFKNLNDTAREAVEAIRRAPQLSLAFTTKQRRIGIDEYLGTLIFDYGVADRINLTLNGSYSYNDSDFIGADLRGFKFGGKLQFQLNRENLLGKKPLFFDISTSGSWMNNVDAQYKAQGKLTIPIADGIDFPISVTWANRSNLIDEKEVRGQFGFTLDTARLIRAFLFR
jgi:hypothetical protein